MIQPMLSHGPFYTLDDAQIKLDVTKTDLLYAIEQGELSPVLQSPRRQYLVISTDSEGRRTGRGHFTYQGPIEARSTLFSQLINQQQGKFYSIYRPLAPANTSAFSADYSFRSGLPNSALIDWCAVESYTLLTDEYQIVTMPYESQSPEAMVKLAAGLLTQEKPSSSVENLKKVAALPYQYNWDHNGQWSLSDIRIPASEIQRFQLPGPQDEPARHNQLHELIKRINKSLPGRSTNEFIHLLKLECDAEKKRYDVDNILRDITNGNIAWKSAYENQQIMKRKTLQNFLSKLRKK
jgi:hypothetical protein